VAVADAGSRGIEAKVSVIMPDVRILGILALLLLAGCGGAAVSPAVQSSPTPDIPALARQYQAAADRSNKAQDDLKAKSDAGRITKEQQFVGVADTEHQFADDLAKITFPPSMEADARDLGKAVSLYEQVLRSLAKAKSPLEQAALVSDFTKAKNELGAATDRLRRDLKLPPAGD
jgi:hypothetical protein